MQSIEIYKAARSFQDPWEESGWEEGGDNVIWMCGVNSVMTERRE